VFNDPLGIVGQDAVGEGVSDIMSEANEEAVVLAGVGGKVGLNSLEVNRFVPDKAEDSADVNDGAGKKLKGDFMAERRGGQVVENETDVLCGE
jgi:hypothetical protein